MPSVEQFDSEIAEKDQEFVPLAEAADAALERCLDRFAAALAPKIVEYARRSVIAEPDVTEDLSATGRLDALKKAITSLEKGSRELVEKCFRSAQPWVHLHPPAYSPWDQDHAFTPRVMGSAGAEANTRVLDPSSWKKPLNCLSSPITAVFKTYGYKRAAWDMTFVEWPADVWEALADYDAVSRKFMTIWKERARLQSERAALAAANAWDTPG
jgi:hypothetical protein